MNKETFINCEFETYEVGDVVTLAGDHADHREAKPHRYEIINVIYPREDRGDDGVVRGCYGVRRLKDHLMARWQPWGNVTKTTCHGSRRMLIDAHTIPNTLTPRQKAAETKRIAAFHWHPKGHPLRRAT